MYNTDKIYRLQYTLNETEYFSFSKQVGNDVFLDIITNVLYRNDQLKLIDHSEVDPKVIKYYSKLYRKEKNLTVFKFSNYDQNYIHLYSNILRFFDLKYEDLLENSKNIELKNKIINKAKKYLKRYYPSDSVDEYISNLNDLDDICYILSYKPNETLHYSNKFYWFYIFMSFEKHNQFLFNLPFETFKTFKNVLNLDINKFIENKEIYKSHIENCKINYFNNLELEYKNKIIKTIQDRIENSKNTIENEKKYAKEINDKELLFEVETISEILHEIETKIFSKLETVTLQANLFEIWPEILYPISDAVNDPYFHDNKTLENIDYILDKI
jgi:hypothetical protein